MKVAIVHDWLVTYAGAERVLEQMLNCYPNADIYSLVKFLDDDSFIKNKDVKTSFIQRLPFSKSKYRLYLGLMPLAVEQFDLSEYDLIISSSHAVAKGVLTGPDQLHICMCYSPIRYAWDLQHQYLKESNLERGLKSFLARLLLHSIRKWDLRTVNGVDHFIGISKFIQRRIMKLYRRDAKIIYPPVDTEMFKPLKIKKKDFYVTCSRMVPYKKIDLIVQTFSEKHPEKELVVMGDGPDYKKIKKLAGSNIKMLGQVSFETLHKNLNEAKAFIFAAEEDFGISPIEAQSCGTPVIAYKKGAANETIIGLNAENPTGVLFENQTMSSLSDAITLFEKNYEKISSTACIENASRFSINKFCNEFKDFIELKFQQHEAHK